VAKAYVGFDAANGNHALADVAGKPKERGLFGFGAFRFGTPP